MPLAERRHEGADRVKCSLDGRAGRVPASDQADGQDTSGHGAAHTSRSSHSSAEPCGNAGNGFVVDGPGLAHGEQDALRSIEAAVKKLERSLRHCIVHWSSCS